MLAAAMWQNPHMLIMDEPTNYLDREALGALAEAVNKWTGGVVIFSHHQEFIGAVCSEVRRKPVCTCVCMCRQRE